MKADSGADAQDRSDLTESARVRLRADRTASAGREHLWFRTDSPLGTVLVAHCDGYVSGLRLAKNSESAIRVVAKDRTWEPMDADDFASHLVRADCTHRRLRVAVAEDPDPDQDFVEMVRTALAEGRTDVPIDISSLAGPMHKSALSAATRIPREETRSYADVAEMAGSSRNAAQSVGNAMMRNPVPLLIPCHRVIRSGGALGSWGFGAELKKLMLAREGCSPSCD